MVRCRMSPENQGLCLTTAGRQAMCPHLGAQDAGPGPLPRRDKEGPIRNRIDRAASWGPRRQARTKALRKTSDDGPGLLGRATRLWTQWCVQRALNGQARTPKAGAWPQDLLGASSEGLGDWRSLPLPWQRRASHARRRGTGGQGNRSATTKAPVPCNTLAPARCANVAIAPCAFRAPRLDASLLWTTAGWRRGYAADCKSVKTGSIPVPASTNATRLLRSFGIPHPKPCCALMDQSCRGGMYLDSKDLAVRQDR